MSEISQFFFLDMLPKSNILEYSDKIVFLRTRNLIFAGNQNIKDRELIMTCSIRSRSSSGTQIGNKIFDPEIENLYKQPYSSIQKISYLGHVHFCILASNKLTEA